MSKRRRIFDIELPEEPEAEAAPQIPEDLETKSAVRRGPMASAVRETADSLRQRREVEASIRAENDALAHEHVRLKKLGLIVDLAPLDAIDTTKLVRDRAPGPDPELEDLKASIREIGLSNPIRVERNGARFELIQGWRRLQAFKALRDETGDPEFATIPAAMVAPGDDIETSYRRMVDENMVRKDISFAEMADLARSYAADPQTSCMSVQDAVPALFRSANYQKRSYIRAFAQLLDMLDKHLLHAQEIPRNLGLAVRQKLEDETGALLALVRALEAAPNRTAEQEVAVLRRFVGGEVPEASDAPREAKPAKSQARSPRTTFRVIRPEGDAKCTAAKGRLELRGATDFSSYDRARLERAVAAFYRALEE